MEEQIWRTSPADAWEPLVVGAPTREAVNPDGQVVVVRDAVLHLRRV